MQGTFLTRSQNGCTKVCGRFSSSCDGGGVVALSVDAKGRACLV